MKKTLTLLSFAFVMNASAQVANPSLETWVNYSAGIPPTSLERPTNWFGIDSIIYDPTLSLMGVTPARTLYKDASSHSGSFATKLTSKNIGIMVAPGVLSNASMELDIQNIDLNNPLNSLTYTGGTAVSQRYNSLTAWVKYIPSGTDVAVVSVQAIKTGFGPGGSDSAIGEGNLYLSAMSAYSQITVPITYTDATNIPDKILIAFLSSDLSGDNGTTPQDGSTLFVDDVALSMVADVKDIYKEAVIANVYPNPASQFLKITADNNHEMNVRIFSTNGALISNTTFKNSAALQLSNIASGQYFYEIKDTKDKKIQRGSFSVTH